MADLFNVFSKQNWCRFILAILLTWAFTYTGSFWETFKRLLKEHLSIEDAKPTFALLLVLFYFLVYPVLDKFMNFKETVCPFFEGTNPLEQSDENDEE